MSLAFIRTRLNLQRKLQQWQQQTKDPKNKKTKMNFDFKRKG
jgi:hypothetical protein